MSAVIFVKKNELLFEEGDYPEHMYIVKTGGVILFVVEGTVEHTIAHAGPAMLIGEMALFDKKFRSASARAVVDSELIKLPYLQLESDFEKLPEWVKITLKTLSEKIRAANNKLLK